MLTDSEGVNTNNFIPSHQKSFVYPHRSTLDKTDGAILGFVFLKSLRRQGCEEGHNEVLQRVGGVQLQVREKINF